jgi:hypothetical protein
MGNGYGGVARATAKQRKTQMFDSELPDSSRHLRCCEPLKAGRYVYPGVGAGGSDHSVDDVS